MVKYDQPEAVYGIQRAVTPQEVADTVRISRQTVHNLLKEGRIKYVRFGRIIRTTLEDVAYASEIPGLQRTRKMFLENVEGLYKAYGMRYPKKVIEITEELRKIWNDYADRYALGNN